MLNDCLNQELLNEAVNIENMLVQEILKLREENKKLKIQLQRFKKRYNKKNNLTEKKEHVF